MVKLKIANKYIFVLEKNIYIVFQQNGIKKNRKTTSAIDRNIIINVKKNRFVSAAKLAFKVQEDHNIKVTPQTIRNRIREQGYRGKVVRKKPFLTAKQMKRRFEFA